MVISFASDAHKIVPVSKLVPQTNPKLTVIPPTRVIEAVIGSVDLDTETDIPPIRLIVKVKQPMVMVIPL